MEYFCLVSKDSGARINNSMDNATEPFPGQKVVERALSVVHGEEAQVRMVIMYPNTAETMDVLGNTGCFFTLGLPKKVNFGKVRCI